MRRSTFTAALMLSMAFLVISMSSSEIVKAQDDDVLLEKDMIGVEVLLNNNDVTMDTSHLVSLAYEGYVNIPDWSPDIKTFNTEVDLQRGPFLFRSHFDPELGVLMAPEDYTDLVKEQLNINIDMEGWSILIFIPGTKVMENPYDFLEYKVRPDVKIDPEKLDWSSAMRKELDWLVSIGVIQGLEDEDIEDISETSYLGTMGPNKRVFYFPYTGEWERFNEITFSELHLLGVGPGVHQNSELPDKVAPIQGEQEYVISTTLVIVAASVFVSLLIGSFFFQRINRAVKLNNKRRQLIYDMIKNEPGVHFSAIMKELNLKPGVASYHINRLEKMELIKSFQDGMYRRFYLFDDKIEMKIALSDVQTLIINVIEDEPGISQVGISKVIGKSKVVINYHVRFLRDLGILILEREGRNTHCFLTERGSEFANV
jgi:predicted transcriptional regulator